MKKFTALFSAILFCGSLWAQEMPQPSPSATVMQRVGLTDITINYSRPGVKGRTIFGDLVPYGELWRTGANKATSITFSTDVSIAGQDVKAGTYALFTIPQAEEWVIILNTNTELWGTGGYSQSNDALRVTVAAGSGAAAERFTIGVDNMTDNSADITLAWSTTKVVIPVTVPTEKLAEANMAKGLADAARACRAAAEHHAKLKDYEKALMYIDQSIALNNYWYTNWLKAEMLAQSGDKKAAKKQAEVALELGDAYYAARNEAFTYKEGLLKEMAAW